MSVETAETIVYAVAGIGIVVWFAGLRFMMSAARLPRVMRDTATENFDATGPLPENVVADSAEVAGNAAELARKAASLLASRMLGQMGQLKILEADDEHVVFDGMDHALPHQGVGRGQLRFTSVSANQSTVTYAVVASGGKGLLIGGVVCVVLGALALSVGFWLITIYVVAHPNRGSAAKPARWFRRSTSCGRPSCLAACTEDGTRSSETHWMRSSTICPIAISAEPPPTDRG